MIEKSDDFPARIPLSHVNSEVLGIVVDWISEEKENCHPSLDLQDSRRGEDGGVSSALRKRLTSENSDLMYDLLKVSLERRNDVRNRCKL